MAERKMIYVGDEEREVPGIGVYKPGDEVAFNETLMGTGLFRVKENKKQKEAEE